MPRAARIRARGTTMSKLTCPSDVDVIEPLRRSLPSAPPEFYNWFKKHLGLHDSMQQPRTEVFEEATESQYRPRASFKCWNEQCAHYIYGFASQQERDDHSRVHADPTKRDSVHAMETPRSVPLSGNQSLGLLNSSRSLRQLPTVQTRDMSASSSLHVIGPQPPTKEKDEMSINYTFHAPTESRSTRRGSGDADGDSMLPPLKRSKTNQPRLESIGELQLFREPDPCLRCKICKKNVCTASPQPAVPDGLRS
jgi:hypothetical protein